MLSIIGIINQSFKMSIQNILSNRMRSFLTMLGIIIGVSSVIALITIMQGAKASVMGEFGNLGAGQIMIEVSGTPMKEGLTDKEIKEISMIEGVDRVEPEVVVPGSVILNKVEYKKVIVKGETADFFKGDKIQRGRAFYEGECGGDTKVCVVDEVFLKKVMSGKASIGSKIIINGYTYTIIGIMKKDGGIQFTMEDSSKSNGKVYIPYRNGLAMQGKRNIYSLNVYAKEGVNSGEVEARLRKYLDRVFNKADDAYFLMGMDSIMDSMNQVLGILTGLLVGIASIALVVGGIGIMNMMLVSVSERTKEIGLRKALGAEPARIQLQFLIESIVLSLVGGMIGIIVGLLLAFVASILLESQFNVVGSAIYIGVGFSVGVGVLFGWMPAKRASNLNPIDALRSE